MRKQSFVEGEYYHIYNRGVDKRDIFSDEEDLNRFIECLIGFNDTDVVGSLSNLRKSKTTSKALSRNSKKSIVSIVAYCLNSNHFHFILKQSTEGGISKFMQKLQAGYTSYFNLKNSRTGSLFQGTFKSHLASDDKYFNKIFPYVNNNYQIHDIPKNKLHLVFASDKEYKNKIFKIVSREEGEEILNIFNSQRNFDRHCKEIVQILRKEKGRLSLSDEENLPDSA